MMQPGGVPTDPGPEARVWIHRMELGDRQGKSSGITNKLLCYKSKRRIIKINQNTEWLTKSSQTTCLDLFNKTQASWNPGCFKIHWKRDFKIANHICTFSPIYSFFSPSESLCESESLKPLFGHIWSFLHCGDRHCGWSEPFRRSQRPSECYSEGSQATNILSNLIFWSVDIIDRHCCHIDSVLPKGTLWAIIVTWISYGFFAFQVKFTWEWFWCWWYLVENSFMLYFQVIVDRLVTLWITLNIVSCLRLVSSSTTEPVGFPRSFVSSTIDQYSGGLKCSKCHPAPCSCSETRRACWWKTRSGTELKTELIIIQQNLTLSLLDGPTALIGVMAINKKSSSKYKKKL